MAKHVIEIPLLTDSNVFSELIAVTKFRHGIMPSGGGVVKY